MGVTGAFRKGAQIDINLHFHIDHLHVHLPSDTAQLARIETMLSALTTTQGNIMSALSDANTKLDSILASEDDEASAISVLGTSVQQLLTNDVTLKQDLADALAAAALAPEIQAKVDSALQKSTANTQAIKDAIAGMPA